MDTAYVEGIVRRLTSAQRRAVETDCCRLGTLNLLRSLGLAETAEIGEPNGPYGDRFKPRWSPLGLAVKAHVIDNFAPCKHRLLRLRD